MEKMDHEEMMDEMESDDKEPQEFEVDSAVEALLRAEEIKNKPKLMKKVMEKLTKKQQAISSLQELKDVAYLKSKEDDSGEE